LLDRGGNIYCTSHAHQTTIRQGRRPPRRGPDRRRALPGLWADGAGLYRRISGIDYFSCAACGSLFAHHDFLARIDAGEIGNYQSDCWQQELKASRERCFGSSLLRVAETIAYCRILIRRFIDIGVGTRWLLDALEILLPEAIDRFHAVELFPPPPPHRTRNPNYHVGTLADLGSPFDIGIFVEVIEHLTPATLLRLIADLATVSRPASPYFFNSGRPSSSSTRIPAISNRTGAGTSCRVHWPGWRGCSSRPGTA
jgi:hypothetical protein